jgi:hypothetical protein
MGNYLLYKITFVFLPWALGPMLGVLDAVQQLRMGRAHFHLRDPPSAPKYVGKLLKLEIRDFFQKLKTNLDLATILVYKKAQFT